MTTPRLEINLSKIAHNCRELKKRFDLKNVGLTGVTKVVCGDSIIAKTLYDSGITTIADSRIENIINMRQAGISAEFHLLRTPFLSQIELVIDNVDVSFNSELLIIKELSKLALEKNRIHKVILMVDLGDLREGIMPDELENVVSEVIKLKGVQLIGIGTTFACFAGVKPDISKMDYFSLLTNRIEVKFKISLEYISGGTSANYNWLTASNNIGRTNNLRLGEAIYFGREPLYRNAIEGLYTDAISFLSEAIESKVKPSLPDGELCQNAFGEVPTFTDYGRIRRVILGAGRQDILVSGLTSKQDITILGASSDHIVIDAKQESIGVGDEVKFEVDYGALLAAMTSPFVVKKYIF